jgi:hypothetical protein
MHDVAELLDLHQGIDIDSLGSTDTVHVVAREVDEHNVLGSILERVLKSFGEAFILCQFCCSTTRKEWTSDGRD